jgi:uncharacterized delta-60 repeat protein
VINFGNLVMQRTITCIILFLFFSTNVLSQESFQYKPPFHLLPDESFQYSESESPHTFYGLGPFARQPDGKIIVVGHFDFWKTPIRQIARLHADGTLDESFIPQIKGDVALESTSDWFWPTDVAIQSTGGIVVGVDSHKDGAQRIFKLNMDGSWDDTFKPLGNTGDPVLMSVKQIVLQPDDKILVLGKVVLNNIEFPGCLFRLNSNGTYDSTFTTTTDYYCTSVPIAVQPDGKILVRNCTSEGMKRLNYDDTVDTIFTPTTSVTGPYVFDIAYLSKSGKIFAGCQYLSNGLYRFNSDGSMDGSFNPPSEITSVSSITPCPNGNFYISGVITFNGKSEVGGAFVDENGIVLKKYSYYSRLADKSYSYCFPLANDDVLLSISGSNRSINGQNIIIKMNQNGIDASFNPVKGFNGIISQVCHQTDGKIIVSGGFNFYSEKSIGSLARLNRDGTVDSTFNPNGVGLNSPAACVTQRPDGKLIVAGGFSQYNRENAYYLLRLNEDGSRDATFTPATSYFSNGSSVLINSTRSILPDGDKIIVGGNGLLKLNADGTRDPAFKMTSKGSYFDIKFAPDGKILVAGNFSTFREVSTQSIAKVNPDGSADPSFSLAAFKSLPTIYSLAVQPDGKILAAGLFELYDEQHAVPIVRLNTNGTIDSTFHAKIPDWTYRWIRKIELLPDERILICTFSSATQPCFSENRAVASIILLNEDGSLARQFNDDDQAFAGPSSVYTMSVQENNVVICGDLIRKKNGSFASYLASFKIEKIDQTLDGIITISKNYNSADFTLPEVKASSGLSVTFGAPSDTTVIKIDNGVVHIVGSGTATVSVAQAGNYAFNPVTGVIIVEVKSNVKLNQTLEGVEIIHKFSNDPEFNLPVVRASSGLPVTIGQSSDEHVITLYNGIVHIVGPGTATIAVAQSGNDIYNSVSGLINIVVTQFVKLDQILIVTGTATIHKFSDDPDFSLPEITSSSTLPVLIGQPSDTAVIMLENDKVHINGPGIATVTVTQAGNSTYNPVTGHITIIVKPREKLDQNINFSASFNSKKYGDVPFTLNAIASSGLPVLFSSSNEKVATVNGNIVTIVGVGSTVITASQPGNAQYKPAADVSHNLIVGKSPGGPAVVNEFRITISPNPATTKLTIHCDEAFTSISVTDMQGKERLTIETTGTEYQLDVSALGKGTYIIIVKNQKGETDLQRVIIP